jgi:hypothetical protein
VVVEILRMNVEQHPKLSRKNMTRIAYELVMCGTDMKDAAPSILVFCPNKDWNAVRLLQQTLTQSHLRAQYYCGIATPGFRIFFWAKALQLLGSMGEVADIYLRGPAIAGARVVSAQSHELLCTVSCGLRVAGSLFALTSAHAFEGSGDEHETELPTEATIDDISSDEISFVDAEYDFPDFDPVDTESTDIEELGDSSQPPPPLDKNNQTVDFDPLFRHDNEVVIPACRLLLPSKLKVWAETHKNLDWSLLKLDNEAWGPGHFCEAQPPQIIPPEHKRQVQILVSSGEWVRGSIRSTPSYISSPNSAENACEVWAVTVEIGSTSLDRDIFRSY